ncbi:amidohydrolase [Nesterenkonia rhizosphaerae]|uniref:M20 family metallopeptidase n=1 Tax=Nesterenkonia rhizosphaerae TaxID=1348272 RepID=A0ABP9FS09_9MICC
MSSEGDVDTTAKVDAEVERATAGAAGLQEIIAELQQRLVEFRRDIHAHPELSFQETRTTERILTTLREAGLDPQPLPETTGAYVDIGPEGAEFAAGFRGDIDALPVTETTGLPYASTVEGTAHACGHDIHTTVMLGLALTLERLHTQRISAGHRQGLGKRIRVIFQPAEETMPGGAKEVVRLGLLQPLPQIFALHCDPKLTVGSIGTRIGPITSAGDIVRIEVTGRGGHTSRPHLTEDVVGALGHIATSVPAVLARRIDVRSGVSLVWGHIQAGNAANAIPSTGILHGTMRILDAGAWKEAGGVLAPVVQQAASSYGVDVTLDHVRGVPPVNNTEAETSLIEEAARRVLAPKSVVLAEQSMGGEDFGWMTHEIPGSMFRLGTKTPGGEEYDLHRGDYTPDEGAITVGVKVMAAVAEAAVHSTS